VCPECSFPLARYAKRVKWLRLFRLGVALLTISILLYLAAWFADVRDSLAWVMRVSAGVGTLAFLIGVAGLVVGGRRGVDDHDSPGS
jgi:hypothetical protein